MCKCSKVAPEQLLSLHRAFCLQRDLGSNIMPNAPKWIPQCLVGVMVCSMILVS